MTPLNVFLAWTNSAKSGVKERGIGVNNLHGQEILEQEAIPERMRRAPIECSGRERCRRPRYTEYVVLNH